MECVKRLVLPHAANIRDMGGFVTKNGKAVRWNRLFRADALSALTESEWQALWDKGVRTVIDLRSGAEVRMFPDHVPQGMTFAHCPLFEDDVDMQNLDTGAAAAFRKSMVESYIGVARDTPWLLGAALHTVSEGLKNGAVIFHCTAGKDRTGILAATILYLLDAYACDIMADYEVSNTYNRDGLHKSLESQANYDELLPLLNSNPDNIRALLLYYEQQADLRTDLSLNGFSEADLADLRAAVLE